MFWLLELAFDAGERRRPRFGVLAQPAVVDEPDRDGVEEVQLLAAAPASDYEVRLLEHLQVLHHAEARHRQPALERGERLAVLLEQEVEQRPPRRVRQRLEHLVHDQRIGDHMVTCQTSCGAIVWTAGRYSVARQHAARRASPRRNAGAVAQTAPVCPCTLVPRSPHGTTATPAPASRWSSCTRRDKVSASRVQ